MNPNDQPTDHSSAQHGANGSNWSNGPSASSYVAPADPASPSLPSPVGPAAAVQQPVRNFYRAEDGDLPSSDEPETSPASPRSHDSGEEVVWTAPEFIDEDKSPGWYLAMIGASLVVVFAVYFITHDLFNMAIVVVAAIIFGVVAGRKPREMHYAVDEHGIEIGRRFYPYANFRSFSIAEDGRLRYIVLMPLKRFMPPLNIYYNPADEDRIGDVLAASLPYAAHEHDLTERLMRRIHF